MGERERKRVRESEQYFVFKRIYNKCFRHRLTWVPDTLIGLAITPTGTRPAALKVAFRLLGGTSCAPVIETTLGPTIFVTSGIGSVHTVACADRLLRLLAFGHLLGTAEIIFEATSRPSSVVAIIIRSPDTIGGAT